MRGASRRNGPPPGVRHGRGAARKAASGARAVNGQPGTLEFHAAERAVMGLLESPEFKALRNMGTPPSMLTVGAKPKGGKGNG